MTTHPYDDIEAFALGGLDDADARRVLAHADQCSTCAVLLSQAMSSVAAMERPEPRRMSAPIELPTGGSNIVALRRRRWPGAAWWVAAAAVAAAIVLALWNANLRSQSFTVPIASLVHSHFEHHALHGISGAAKVIQSLDGSWLYLVADGLEPHSTYYFWEVTGGHERKIGSFSTNANGRAAAYWQQPAAKITAFVVSSDSSEPTNGGELRWP